MREIEIPIHDEGSEPSHLSLRYAPGGRVLDAPSRNAILYLHGFGSSQEGEKALFFRQRFVEAGMPFCSLDFQGHGLSGGSLADITLARNLADVEKAHSFLRGEGHGSIVVVGSSFGALTGLWYSALHPQEVLAGLHIAPALSMAMGLRSMAGEKGVERWRREGRLRFANEQGEAELAWELLEDLERRPAERLRELYRTPSLLLQGKLDDRVLWRTVVDFAAGCATGEVELHLFADGDHRLADRKERLWDLMRGFLEARGILPSTP